MVDERLKGFSGKIAKLCVSIRARSLDLDPTVQTKAFLLEPKEKFEKNEHKPSIFQILLHPSLVIICLSMLLHFLVSSPSQTCSLF